MERRPAGVAQWRRILRKDFDTIMRFWHCPLPTIAAVRGACLAGGFELALACDLTIAAEDAFFGEPELKFGAGIVAMLLPWMVGPKIAKEIILSGEDRIPAARAYAIGIVNRVVQADELEEAAISIGAASRRDRSRSCQKTKRAINRSLGGAEHAGGARRGTGDRSRHRRRRIAGQGAVHGDRTARGLERRTRWRDARFPRSSRLTGQLADLLVAALRRHDARVASTDDKTWRSRRSALARQTTADRRCPRGRCTRPSPCM